jgi:hypothetical protein
MAGQLRDPTRSNKAGCCAIQSMTSHSAVGRRYAIQRDQGHDQPSAMGDRAIQHDQPASAHKRQAGLSARARTARQIWRAEPAHAKNSNQTISKLLSCFNQKHLTNQLA